MTPQLSPESLAQIRAIVETAVATVLEATLEPRFGAVERRFEGVHHRFEAFDHRFEAFDRRFDEFERRFEGFERRQDQRFDALRTELRDEIRASSAEDRRYFGVLAESLQTKIELVIEGQNGLRETMDRRSRETDARIDGLDRRLVRMSARLPLPRRKR